MSGRGRAHFDHSILIPERTVYQGHVEHVGVPGSEGYLGVLADHAALVTTLAAATLTARKPGGEELAWRVGGGFFEVADNHATVLADEGGWGSGGERGGLRRASARAPVRQPSRRFAASATVPFRHRSLRADMRHRQQCPSPNPSSTLLPFRPPR